MYVVCARVWSLAILFLNAITFVKSNFIVEIHKNKSTFYKKLLSTFPEIIVIDFFKQLFYKIERTKYAIVCTEYALSDNNIIEAIFWNIIAVHSTCEINLFLFETHLFQILRIHQLIVLYNNATMSCLNSYMLS